MLKLVQCEFAKLKRKKIIPLVFLSAFLFPIPITFLMATPRMLEKYPNKSVLFDGLFNMVMGYGVIFLLPCIIGVIAAMLFFMERDNDTFKNLRTIPVTSTQMIMAKIIVLFIFGVIFCLLPCLLPLFAAVSQWKCMVLPINYLLQLNLEYSLQRELCQLSYLWSFSAKHTSSPFCYVCFTV